MQIFCLSVCLQAVHDLHVGALPLEDQISPEEVASHIIKHAGLEHPGRIYRNDFIKAAMTSNTLASILQGTIKAADSPYLHRKQRRNSLGIPLHHGATDHRADQLEHLKQMERGEGDAVSTGSGAAKAGAGGSRRPSLTPEMLDFNSMLQNKH